MIHRRYPFQAKQQLNYLNQNGYYTIQTENINDDVPVEIQSIIKNLWDRDASRRQEAKIVAEQLQMFTKNASMCNYLQESISNASTVFKLMNERPKQEDLMKSVHLSKPDFIYKELEELRKIEPLEPGKVNFEMIARAAKAEARKIDRVQIKKEKNENSTPKKQR